MYNLKTNQMNKKKEGAVHNDAQPVTPKSDNKVVNKGKLIITPVVFQGAPGDITATFEVLGHQPPADDRDLDPETQEDVQSILMEQSGFIRQGFVDEDGEYHDA